MATASNAVAPNVSVKYRSGTADLVLVHLGALLVFWVGVSWAAFIAFAVGTTVHMFCLTAVLHRYFSHRAFKTSRWFQFLMGVVATTAGQHDPIYWAVIHRRHHRYAGTEHDPHSREAYGMFWAHVGWLLGERHPEATAFELQSVHDLAQYPELRFLNRYYRVVHGAYGAMAFALGATLAHFFPGLNTSGLQFTVWMWILGPLVVYHNTCLINSIGHNFGSQRFPTTDGSRNNWLLAIVLLGEGWHNNHHHYPQSERQGFYWWEIDLTHYLLVSLSWLGLIWDLKPVPDRIYAEAGSLPRREEAAAQPN
jgi:stearoyl-CoA desaturase (delta-9 desaturase)